MSPSGTLAERYEYGKPIHGYMYLSVEKGKEKQTRAEWTVWQKAAGTDKVVSFGSCRDAGTLLTAPIHKVGEKGTGTMSHSFPAKPRAAERRLPVALPQLFVTP